MQAPGNWSEVYRQQIAKLRNEPGAILLPETLLSLNQATVWLVQVVVKDQSYLNFRIEERSFVMTNPRNSNVIDSMEKLQAYEEATANQSFETLSWLAFPKLLNGCRSNDNSTIPALFTSKRYAQKYCEKQLAQFIGRL